MQVNAIGHTERKMDGINWIPGTTHLIVTQVKILHNDYDSEGPNANKYRMVNVMWDSGATCNMIHKNLARELNYINGIDVNLTLSTVAGENPVLSKEHVICIMDNSNKIHNILAYDSGWRGYPGIVKASSKAIPRKHLFKLASKFEVPVSQINNINGPIEMLIGIKHDKLAPTKFKWLESEDCCLYKTNFSPKQYLIAGQIKDERNGKVIDQLQWDVNHIDVYNSSYWR